MSSNCPKCGHVIRPGARFCGNCGATLTPPAQPAPTPAQPASAQPTPAASAAEMAEKAKEVAAKAGAVIGPAAAKAGAVVVPAAKEAAAAVAPVAKEAAVKGWAGSRRGMSFFARVMTVGGRAAYSEVFSPLPATRGQVAAPPTASTIPAPVEPAAVALFVISLLAAWLVFSLPDLSRVVAIAGIFVVLLALSWLGVRRPYFTRLTFDGLLARLRRRGTAPHVPVYRFRITEGTTGQPLDIVMVGERKGGDVPSGALVELWGIRSTRKGELRAWKIQIVDASGQPLGTVTAPRLIPLSVALFLPAILILLVWLGSLV